MYGAMSSVKERSQLLQYCALSGELGSYTRSQLSYSARQRPTVNPGLLPGWSAGHSTEYSGVSPSCGFGPIAGEGC